ncbi:copper chaperone PCu(A)C [Glaciimonas sp. Gout2]|uniref:copper chaperone PCu(A)C n=1 Tax=unclassified Glaciimonas TaxID=2644401 RepID=UPI002B22CF70|nr:MULTISPECIES: copper chaperone PCu(A)C [unclassified Glaciimonas]MEB0014103.1 copper chaperone PCu(A)C [Glaciimonas sp. Cout2]MEB0083435.1 copper chaperone PCu(A)C [Glaciimonas sp. Gout2]
MFPRLIVSVFACIISASVCAHDYKLGALKIDHPYARATVPGQPSGGAYLSIENTGPGTDKLLGATSPAAKSVEIHTMRMDGDVMKMREVGEVELQPTSTLNMAPGGGFHIMLMGLTKPLKVGDKFPMTLTFQKAGKIDVSVSVDDMSSKPGTMHQH